MLLESSFRVFRSLGWINIDDKAIRRKINPSDAWVPPSPRRPYSIIHEGSNFQFAGYEQMNIAG